MLIAVGDAATVIAFDYDTTFRRMTKQRVTQVGTGVDDSVRAIGYAYDALGRRTTVTSYDDPDDQEPANVLNQVQYTFNDLGMLLREYQEHSGDVDDESTLYVAYAYDETDDTPADGVYDKGMRPKSVQYPNTRTVHTLYVDPADGSGIGDKISRVTALASADNRGVDDANVYAAYAYNGAGRIVLETQKHAGSTVAELDYYQGAAGTYAGFDRFGRVQDQKWTHGATVLDRYGYGYDANSNRTYRENSLAADRSEVYAYDMLDRLTGMDRGTLNEQKTAITGTPAREESWNLSQTGNWAGYEVAEDGSPVLNQTRENNKANEITEIETPPEQTQWVVPEYDARGNMITMPKPNSPGSAFTCTWDAWNRLVEVKDGETTVSRYAYDGLNHRIVKTVGATIRHAYYNAGWQLLETRETTDPEAAPETIDPKEQYVWSIRYIDAPVLRDRDTDDDGDLDETLYFTNDANMNVTALLDTDGTVLERYAYTPYGKPSFFDASWNPRAASAYDNAILYCGYFYDSETGLYHVRERYLDSSLGLWLSRDPGGYVDGMGLYEYVKGRTPVSRDPFGVWTLVADRPEEPWSTYCADYDDTWDEIALNKNLAPYKGDYRNWARRWEDGMGAIEPFPVAGRRYLISNEFCPKGLWEGTWSLGIDAGAGMGGWVTSGFIKCSSNGREAVFSAHGWYGGLVGGVSVPLIDLNALVSNAYHIHDLKGAADFKAQGASYILGLVQVSLDIREGHRAHFFSESIVYSWGLPAVYVHGKGTVSGAPKDSAFSEWY